MRSNSIYVLCNDIIRKTDRHISIR
jgi:hypothetical protein